MAAKISKTKPLSTAQRLNGPSQAPGSKALTSAPISRVNDPEILEFAKNVARLLLAAGVDLATLQIQMQRAYIEAASQLSNFRNKKPNQSGIAAMTGLTRTEVKKLLLDLAAYGNTERKDNARGVERVIHGWLTDREFSKDSESPYTLARGKGFGTFDTLVSRYGADVPTAAVLRELIRRKRVTANKSFVSIRIASSKPPVSSATRRFMAVISPILESLSERGSSPIELETQSTTIELPEDISHALLKAHLAAAVPVFFEQARIAASGVLLSRRRTSRTPKGPTVRLQFISLTRK